MSIHGLNIILSDVSEVSELAPLIIGYSCRIRQLPYRIIVGFFTVSAPLKLISLVTARMHMNNMILFHILALCEVIFLYSFFNWILFNRVRIWGITALIVANLLDTLFLEGLMEFNAIAWSVNTFVLLCLGLTVFYRFFVSLEELHLEKNATFIITSGLMIYFAGAMFTYILSSKILSGQAADFFHNAWIIQSFSNIIKNLIVGYGLWLARYP